MKALKEQGYNIIELIPQEPIKKDYDFNKMPLNPLIVKTERGYEFPIEFIPKRLKPIVKLPFRLGKLLLQTGEEIVK